MITITDLADELDIHQTPDQPYSPADLLAEFDATLTDTYGPLTGDTEISEDDAQSIRNGWNAWTQED